LGVVRAPMGLSPWFPMLRRRRDGAGPLTHVDAFLQAIPDYGDWSANKE
jgi:hypothetical protein